MAKATGFSGQAGGFRYPVRRPAMFLGGNVLGWMSHEVRMDQRWMISGLSTPL